MAAFSLVFVSIAGLVQIIVWGRRRLYVRSLFWFVFIVRYPMDLLWINGSQEVYLSATIYGPLPDSGSLTTAAVMVVGCWVVMSAVVSLSARGRGESSLPRVLGGDYAPYRLRFFAFVLLTSMLSLVIISKVALHGVEQTLASRQTVFGDDPVALLAYYALPPLAVFGAAALGTLSWARRFVVVILIVVSLGVTFLTGSRSGLLLSFLLPILALAWRGISRRLRGYAKDMSRILVVGSLVLAASFGGAWYVSEFRGVSTSEGFFRSTDLSQADVLVALVAANPPVVGGSSYLAGVTTLIPRSVWQAKPLPGNVWSSIVLTPARCQLTGAETAAGLLGEAFLNFHLIGFLVAGLLLGLIVVLCERLTEARRPDLTWIFGVLLVTRGINIVRGDLANVWAPVFVALLAWLIVVKRTRARVEGQGPEPEFQPSRSRTGSART